MTASYPGTLKTFVTHVNTTEVIDASHVNDLQDEVIALEGNVGLNAHVSSSSLGSTLGAWSAPSRTYVSLSDRLANIEAGHLADTHTHYMRLANAETVTGSKSFTATDTFFGAGTGTTAGNISVSSGTTGGQAMVQWREGTTSRWSMLFIQGSASIDLRDATNARSQVTYTGGASATAAQTAVHSRLTVDGDATLSGALSVAGASTLAALTLSGAFTLAPGTGTAASSSQPGFTAAGGTSTAVARADHVHGREAWGTTTADTAVAGSAAPGSAISVSRSDHVHVVNVGPVTSGTTYGTAAANGTATTTARSDHTHGTPPLPTATQLAPALPYETALPSVGSRSAGVVNSVSRGDHSHGPSSTKGFTMTMMGA